MTDGKGGGGRAWPKTSGATSVFDAIGEAWTGRWWGTFPTKAYNDGSDEGTPPEPTNVRNSLREGSGYGYFRIDDESAVFEGDNGGPRGKSDG